MPRVPDLVVDSKLHARFSQLTTIHSFPEIDEAGRRSSRTEQWQYERYLGHGGYGQVRLEKCVTLGDKQDALRAVKHIAKQSNPRESLDLSRELEVIAKFSNDRYKRWFVKSFGWYEDSSSIFIIMEYCQHGDLHHFLSSRDPLHVTEAQQLTYQILDGLHQMHENDFAHRDLKPGNILIKSKPPNENWWIVLADFGISKRADEGNGPTTAIRGSSGFMAPELLGFLDDITPKHISDFKAADIWALGEIAFRMLTGEASFRTPRELMAYSLEQRSFPSDRLPPPVGDDGKEFINRLMELYPDKRLTTTQCFSHRWMEPQRAGVEEELADLRLEQIKSSGITQSETDRDASGTWTTTTTTPSHQEGSDRCQLEHIDQYLSAQENPKDAFHPKAALMTLEGHERFVLSIAFSPDGKTLASTSKDKIIKLWNVQSGAKPQTFRSPYPVHAITFSPDGKTLALGGEKTVMLWTAPSGTVLKILNHHTAQVNVVAFSPDGKTLASASTYGTVRLWNVQTGEMMQELKNGIWITKAVAFSPHGKVLAYGLEDGRIKLYDAQSGTALKTFTASFEPLTDVSFSPDGNILASASKDRRVSLWDRWSGARLHTLLGHSGRRNIVAFSPDGKTLASASDDCTVRLWDVQSGAALQTLEGHTRDILDVAFSPDGKTLASAGYDCTVRLWA